MGHLQCVNKPYFPHYCPVKSSQSTGGGGGGGNKGLELYIIKLKLYSSELYSPQKMCVFNLILNWLSV